jgi:nucleotide-binding universal stress UspA family protein
MLARLQSAMGRDDLIEQILLLPEAKQAVYEQCQLAKSVNLIVGYDGSPNSHTALDIAFLIAYQTRLATNQEVIVQAVYVLEEIHDSQNNNRLRLVDKLPKLECPIGELSKSSTSVLTQPKLQGIASHLQQKTLNSLHEADIILWQARSLAEEWQGSFKSHLRFGGVSTELRTVIENESADILFLGCKSVYHPLIKQLHSNFPCAVVGIPNCIDQ